MQNGMWEFKCEKMKFKKSHPPYLRLAPDRGELTYFNIIKINPAYLRLAPDRGELADFNII